MIDISERITSMTLGGNATTGARVTLGFNRSVPLQAGQVVRLRYDLAGNGQFQDCVGIALPTHTVARRGHLVVFHYRLSHWIPNRSKRA